MSGSPCAWCAGLSTGNWASPEQFLSWFRSQASRIRKNCRKALRAVWSSRFSSGSDLFGEGRPGVVSSGGRRVGMRGLLWGVLGALGRVASATYRGRESATTQLIRQEEGHLLGGENLCRRQLVASNGRGQDGAYLVSTRQRAGATPKAGGPGPQRGPKRGVAPALLPYLPAPRFSVFSFGIWFIC